MDPHHDVTEAAVIKQVTALTAITGFLAGAWPIIVAIPAFVYYILLVIEKVMGKKISEMLWKRKSDSNNSSN